MPLCNHIRKFYFERDNDMRWRDIAMIGVWLLTACRTERPVTSSIIIDLEKPTQPVQEALYGVTLEEMNHAILLTSRIAQHPHLRRHIMQTRRHIQRIHALIHTVLIKQTRKIPRKISLRRVSPDDPGGMQGLDPRSRRVAQTREFISNRERSRSEERRVGKECRSRWSPYH